VRKPLQVQRVANIRVEDDDLKVLIDADRIVTAMEESVVGFPWDPITPFPQGQRVDVVRRNLIWDTWRTEPMEIASIREI